METLEIVEQTLQTVNIDSEQFKFIIEQLERSAEYQMYIATIQIAILAFIALGVGVMLCIIFARYMRGVRHG